MGRKPSYDYVSDGTHLYQRIASPAWPLRSYYVRVKAIPQGTLRGLPLTEAMLQFERGKYLRVHYSILAVDCPFCHAKKGQRCVRLDDGCKVNYRHHLRARAARELKLKH